MKKLKIALYSFSAFVLFNACEKEIDGNASFDCKVEESDLKDGELIEIDGSEYEHFILREKINKIVINDGNGTLHIKKGDKTEVSLPGFWVMERGLNNVQIEDSALIFSNTFTDSYLQLSDLAEIEIVMCNAQVEIDPAFAEGDMNLIIGGNSTIEFMDVNSSLEELQEFDVDVLITENGTFNGYGTPINNLHINLEQNGTARVHVLDSFIGSIESNGTIYYKGKPAIFDVGVTSFGELIDQN